MVVGDRQKHLACLLTVKAVMDPATLEVTTQGPNIDFNPKCRLLLKIYL